MDSTTNFQDLTNTLSTGITPEALWGAIAPFGGVIVVLVLFSFGYRIFRKIIGKASKGKA